MEAALLGQRYLRSLELNATTIIEIRISWKQALATIFILWLDNATKMAPPVRDKLYKHGCTTRRACSRYVQMDKSVLYALVLRPDIADLWSYVEQPLLCMRRIHLSAGIVEMTPPPPASFIRAVFF